MKAIEPELRIVFCFPFCLATLPSPLLLHKISCGVCLLRFSTSVDTFYFRSRRLLKQGAQSVNSSLHTLLFIWLSLCCVIRLVYFGVGRRIGNITCHL